MNQQPGQDQANQTARPSVATPTGSPPPPQSPQVEARSDLRREEFHEITHSDGTALPLRPALGLPQRVGNYLLTREIASGGMGTVYEAVQDQPRRVVALKLLRSGRRSPQQLRRFEFESQLLARLRHPAIAQVFEAGTHAQGEQTIPFFAMEFIPGALPITHFVDAKKLSIAQRLTLFAVVCDAVQHAHAKGIIHRDLKPGNILIDAQGAPKVIDFGVARASDSDQFSPTLQTDASQLLGTLQYMSPEQCEIDPRELDARSDVYALGVVLYELLCGRLPYDLHKVNVSDATKVIREQPPVRPSTIDPALKGDIETVMLKALHKDKTRRYQSTGELGQDIRNVLAAEPIGARRDSAIYAARTDLTKRIVRHRISAHVLAAGVALAIAYFIIGTIDRFIPLTGYTTRWLTANVPVRGAPMESLSSVRLIVLKDGTDVAKLATDQHVSGVDPARVPSLRRLHGQLMTRLAESQARVVAFDTAFRKPFDADDQAFVQGAKALREQGIPVVVAVPDWRLDADGRPEISANIAPYVTFGTARLNATADGPWALQLAAGPRGSVAHPSFALATAAAYWRPFATPAYSMDAALGIVEINYQPSPGNVRAPANIAAPLVRLPNAQGLDPRFDRVPLTRAAMYPDETLSTTEGIQPQDIVGHYVLQVPRQRVLDTSTIDYAQALSASPEQLREWCANRVVIVGDACTSSRDRIFDAPDGRRLFGFTAQAVGIEALLNGSEIRQAGDFRFSVVRIYGPHVLNACGVVVGIGLALLLWRRNLLRAAAQVAMVALAVLLAVLIFRYQRRFYPPFIAIVAMVLAAELAACVERIRVGARRLV